MSIQERPGKRGTSYRVAWRDTSGRQQTATFRLRRDAVRFDAARKLDPDWTDIAAETPKGEEPTRKGGPTVADVWRRLEESRDVGASRAATDASMFRVQLAPLHHVRVAELDALAIRKWQKDLRAETREDGRRRYKDSTVAEALGTLRKILSAAIELKLIAYSPAATVKAPATTRPPITAADVYTPAEVALVLAEIPPRYRALFGVMAYSGARLSEVLGLTLATVDAEAGAVRVGVQTTEDVGGRRRVKPDGKTRNANRPIVLIANGAELLREHLAAYPVAPTTDPVAEGCDAGLIFRTESGAIPNRSNLRQRVWNPAVERAGIRHIPMQNLRHTHASWVYGSGMDPLAAAARLGHSRPSMGLDVYARFIAKEDGSDLAMLEDWWSRS